MKATLEIPDELYRRVKAKTAMEGRRVRDVTAELYRRWLGEGAGAAPAQSSGQWLEEWMRLGGEACGNLPPGPTGTEILSEDRNRLERA